MWRSEDQRANKDYFSTRLSLETEAYIPPVRVMVQHGLAMARSTASGPVKASSGTIGEFCREQSCASHDSECSFEGDEHTFGPWDVKRQMNYYHHHSEQMELSSSYKMLVDEEDKPHCSSFSSPTPPNNTFTNSRLPEKATPPTSATPRAHTLPFNASNSAMLRFVAVKKRQFHQQRLKGRFRKVGADDSLQWTPPTPSCPSTSRLQLVPSVKRDIVRSNDTRTLRLRRQSSITLSSAYSRYLSAKPLPILRSGSLKKEKNSIRKRLASMNRNKPLPPIPFPFLSPDKTEVELEPFGSSFASSLSLKTVLNEDDHGKAPLGEADLIPSKECLESRSDQIERPNKDGNKANPTAEKIQGKNSYYCLYGFLLSSPRNTKPNESYHLEPNHHPTTIDTSDKIVKAIANSTVDSAIANLTSIKVEATCPPFSSAEVTSHPYSHSQNNQKNLARSINVDTGNKKDKDQDEPPCSKIDDLRLRSPSFKAHIHSLDMFRFPLRRSPLERHSLLYRPRVLHAHRLSLPSTMSTTPLLARALDLHTFSPSDMGPYSAACSVSTLPKEFKDNPRDDTSSPPSKAHPADKARPLDMASPSMVPKSLLRRSESCSHISHRPTLSLDSSKKALLSLQARRVNKPDAKVVRLPDIQTTTTSYSSSVVVLSQGTDALNTPPGEDFLQGDALLKFHDGHDHDYQLQVSDRDRTVTDALLMDVTTMDAFKAVSGGDMTSLEMRRSNVEVSANKEPQSLEPSMTGLEALSGAPVVDAGEIKRFFKRSHALRELVTTEETYVYDLETLTKVSIFVHVPGSSF